MNSYCGPYALGMVRGTNSDEAACFVRKLHKLREHGMRKSVKGMTHREIGDALRASSQCKVFRSYSERPITLRAFLSSTSLTPEVNYVIAITGHYIVIRNRKMFDNKNPSGMWAESSPYLRRRVILVWECI